MAMTKTIQATVKNRTDTAANWTQKNPVLAEGEIIVVQTSAGETRLKIGDGVKTFTQLPYIDEQIYNNVVTSVNGQTGDVILPGDFIVNVTSTDDINCTLDKTFDQIQEAVQAGKKVYAKLNGVFTIYMPMVLYSSFVLIFAATAFTSESIEQYVLAVPMSNSDGNNPQFLKKLAVTYNSDPTTGEKTMPQVYMSEDPVNNMQIATKKYVDDSTFNTVLYTAQTLTDEQKKQARDNIEAADADFIITATVTDNDNCTTDKTYTQIQEAVQAGKKVVVKISAYGFDFVLPLIGKFESDYMFTAVFNPTNTVVMQFAVVIGEQGSGIVKFRIPTYNSDGNKLEQVSMAAAPTEDMQIATKKYVDDHATGGTDMGITGAAVGQIAKIAAVDASGVPTAWSPADMPSGGSSDFVIIGTVTGETLTTDKTYEQVQEAVQAGKRVTLKVEVYGIDFVLPLIGENSTGYLFTTAATVFPTVTIQFTAVVGASETVWHTEQVASYDSNGNLVQIFMDRDPEQPMEIATKKYVDDKISDKELILSSSTAGSTKKFKLTIDDTGTLTASEITA